ncbi:MAG: hypothetical protein KBD51_02500 [Candidatus Levybacteria bacterium]|nr:hypothetical protein [Candidatus Levybacteria bacterium]
MSNPSNSLRITGKNVLGKRAGTGGLDSGPLPSNYDAQVENYVGLKPGTFSKIEQEAVARKKRPLLEELRDRLHLRREQISGTIPELSQSITTDQPAPVAETPQTTTLEGPSGQGRV